ncbi:hypothetical protein G3O08_00260 [Cryomorpha ignava]|uniref:Uncharacterized protein n=1 Tax=Cryomorpha ignava TaxID=101383 RepID=A0A7K3WMK7_9FLAO|nr:choice-of-anchor L domain-containing protein [Cryomorpha ignava]NEN21935.1 hypothetical protein [Cryomorpha ignava]
MKQLFLSLLFASFVTLLSAQTIVESNEGTVEFIVDSIFGNMNEITVTGFAFNGSPEAICTFESEGPDFPIANGFALSSGHVNSLTDGFGSLSNPYQNDSDLQLYQSAANLYDCVSLEINFIANESQLELAFIFGSDEYPAYICSQFNDIMGILLKPDTSDDYDIYSVVPFTNIPVTVNSLNGLGPQDFDLVFCDEANPDWEETRNLHLLYK